MEPHMLNKPGNPAFPFFMPNDFFLENKVSGNKVLPEILFITSFPPRQCGIATYSQDLILAMNRQFVDSFSLKVCALENNNEKHKYEGNEVKYTLNTSNPESYVAMAEQINSDDSLQSVVIQHEFGFFADNLADFNNFLTAVKKPVVVVFHTVLPHPDDAFRKNVQHIIDHSAGIIVMTNVASEILQRDYIIDSSKIAVIPHGTHLVPHLDKKALKEKYGISNRKVLSTFGLLSSGKSIETTLDALPNIIKTSPDVLFLILGKTHPNVVLHEGEKYREFLQDKIDALNLNKHVKFVNKYLELSELLEYLQMTDIYLFTSKDPNQAVSGTFSYALSCGCPVVSTPIPHAKEVLADGAGMLFDFGNSEQLANAVNTLLFDIKLRHETVLRGLHKITGTCWQNAAVTHGKFLQKLSPDLQLHYRNPEINLDHIKRMTTDFGILQFSKLNQPDLSSGYTIDDNSRALIAVCQYYKAKLDPSVLKYIAIYLNFIDYCERRGGLFMNYVDINQKFTRQNAEVNLEDASGRAMWALGYVVSLASILPAPLGQKAKAIYERNQSWLSTVHSPRAMAFIIKGAYYYSRNEDSSNTTSTVDLLASRLVQMYRHEATADWIWFESYLTYANSVLPEALLCAYAMTGNEVYKDIARKSFDFLLSKTFTDDCIKVVSNKSWHHKNSECDQFGEQPIDVAYTIIALRKFHDIFKERRYLEKMEIAFNWFLGNNHLQQIVYNPCTGGCFDGLEEKNINLNQGSEAAVSYLMARMTIYKYFGTENLLYNRRKSRVFRQAIN